MGKVAATGSGSHSYTFNDVINSDKALLYYRLKLVDADGRFTYSAVIALRSLIMEQKD